MPNRDENTKAPKALHWLKKYGTLAGRLQLSKRRGTYLSVSITGPFMVNSADGSALAFCDIACFNTYSFYVDTDHIETCKKLPAKRGVCFHCAACGRSIYKIKKCVLHDTQCPDYLWLASVPAVLEFKSAIMVYLSLPEVTQEMWDVADVIAASNSLLPGSDLALLTLERLGLA
jgi:predicted RNA-binding Zn-ribbon protein involved in translation (DUF1610 family)